MTYCAFFCDDAVDLILFVNILNVAVEFCLVYIILKQSLCWW